MAVLASQAINRTGVGPTYGAAAGGGDKFTPGNSVFVHVKNGGGSAITATFVTPGTTDGEAIADRAVSVPNGGERMIGPFPPSLFKDSTDGYCNITYSAVTSVTIAVLALQEA